MVEINSFKLVVASSRKQMDCDVFTLDKDLSMVITGDFIDHCVSVRPDLA